MSQIVKITRYRAGELEIHLSFFSLLFFQFSLPSSLLIRDTEREREKEGQSKGKRKDGNNGTEGKVTWLYFFSCF